MLATKAMTESFSLLNWYLWHLEAPCLRPSNYYQLQETGWGILTSLRVSGCQMITGHLTGLCDWGFIYLILHYHCDHHTSKLVDELMSTLTLASLLFYDYFLCLFNQNIRPVYHSGHCICTPKPF